MINKIIEVMDKAVVQDIAVYDMRDRTPFYDYAIIATASTSRQAKAAIKYLKDEAPELDLNVRGVSVSDESKWMLIDLDEVIVHVFVGDERSYYNLDGIYRNN